MKFEEMFGAETPALTCSSGETGAAPGDESVVPPADSSFSGGSPQIPGQLTVEDCIQEAETEEQFVTETTPSGLEIYYSWSPRRHYKVRGFNAEKFKAKPVIDTVLEWIEVPSVTTVLGVLDRSGPLTWWGQGVGAEGVLTLLKAGWINVDDNGFHWIVLPEDEFSFTAHGDGSVTYAGEWRKELATKETLTKALTLHRLTVNHTMDKAADRGVNVHGALEKWCEADAELPDPMQWPEHERGYVEGLRRFLDDIAVEVENPPQSEVMVGSLEHQYAGRYDLRLTLEKPVEVVTKAYPKRADKVEEIPAGKLLIDLKTRRKPAVYASNYMQLEAYERASIECGYEPTDYRAVLVVTPDGKYQLSVNNDWCFDDFLQVRKTYQILHEREILRALREDLGARDVD